MRADPRARPDGRLNGICTIAPSPSEKLGRSFATRWPVQLRSAPSHRYEMTDSDIAPEPGTNVKAAARREIGRDAWRRAGEARSAYEAELTQAARELPGGTAATAVVVVSSSQIEPQASGFSGLACDAPMKLLQHRATTEDGVAVRVLDLECRACGGPRTAYFRIDRPS